MEAITPLHLIGFIIAAFTALTLFAALFGYGITVLTGVPRSERRAKVRKDMSTLIEAYGIVAALLIVVVLIGSWPHLALWILGAPIALAMAGVLLIGLIALIRDQLALRHS